MFSSVRPSVRLSGFISLIALKTYYESDAHHTLRWSLWFREDNTSRTWHTLRSSATSTILWVEGIQKGREGEGLREERRMREERDRVWERRGTERGEANKSHLGTYLETRTGRWTRPLSGHRSDNNCPSDDRTKDELLTSFRLTLDYVGQSMARRMDGMVDERRVDRYKV